MEGEEKRSMERSELYCVQEMKVADAKSAALLMVVDGDKDLVDTQPARGC